MMRTKEQKKAASDKWNQAHPGLARQRAKEWYEKNKERALKSSRAWVAANPEARIAIIRKYAEANRERERMRAVAYRKVNKDKVAAHCRRRQATKIGATPKWADSFLMTEAYHLARLRGAATGFKWHVDHIVPLRGKLVCGLHVEANLQVIPAKQNWSKNNRIWPDMPEPSLGR